MTDYGIQPTGYVRKPISVLLAELEAAMVTEFGPGVIQTPQSPLGQLNGLMADLLAEVDERNLDLYQSYDPDQAEGNRLDILARLRLIYRSGETDAQLRQSVTNFGEARVDVQDISRAVRSIDGVYYSHVFVNDEGETDDNGQPPNSICVSALGGDDNEIAAVIRRYVMPGVSTFGNHRVDTAVDGFCRTLKLLRPVIVPVELEINIKTSTDRNGCAAPTPSAIRDAFILDWVTNNLNGKDINFYNVRQLIESRWSNVEVVGIMSSRDGAELSSLDTLIGFIELSDIAPNDVGINLV